MIQIGIQGAAGQMGRLLIQSVNAAEDLVLAGAFDAQDLGTDAGELSGSGPNGVAIAFVNKASLSKCHVVVDFSLPAGTEALLAYGGDTPLVLATTGLNEDQQAQVQKAAGSRPIVQAANFSTGVNVLLDLVARAGNLLPHAHGEIVEMHHARKRDAPSGTALALAEALASSREGGGGEMIHGRSGISGPRDPQEIGIHSLRGGDVAGEHRVVLASEGERLELCHVAGSRQAFAEGALRAARWVVDQAPGLYGMDDVLGFAKR
jgi:4-hydroxy-tetrahydrodipicolinate reductase